MARIRVSASRPSRLTRTATETLSTESRFTTERWGIGSEPGASTTSLASPRIVVVHGATIARRSRGITASRDSTTTGRRPTSPQWRLYRVAPVGVACVGVGPQQWPRPGRSGPLEHALRQVDADHRQPGQGTGQPDGQPPGPAADVEYRLTGPYRSSEQILEPFPRPPRRRSSCTIASRSS